MATQSTPEQQKVSVEEYLSTVYEPDCEYDDGVVVERNSGEFEHAFLQALLATLFTNNMDSWSVFCLLGQRIQISSRHFLVPDICALRVGSPRENILTRPPLIVIEIMSPDDAIRRLEKKAHELLAFCVQHVWVIDPQARVAYRGVENGLERVSDGVLQVPGTPIEVKIPELFDKLDAIRSKSGHAPGIL